LHAARCFRNNQLKINSKESKYGKARASSAARDLLEVQPMKSDSAQKEEKNLTKTLHD
jgi:hypothetical protein